MSPSFTVHNLPLDERPRERMRREGADKISAQELLAVLLGRGFAGCVIPASEPGSTYYIVRKTYAFCVVIDEENGYI
jgi:hypothetical protein